MGKKLFWLFLAVMCIGGVLAVPLSAAPPSGQVIRVGVFDYEAFYGTDAKGSPYGYGYDYLDALAKYGDFRYEYVHGSWSECLDLLAAGKIDMLDSAQKTGDRPDRFLFSAYSTGMSYGELFVRADNVAIAYNDFAAMDGLTVGLLEGNSRNETFHEYAQQNGFSVKTVTFSTEAQLAAALQTGQVDAIVSSNLRKGENERAVARFAPTPFYLMFRQDQPSLKTQVDRALEQLLVDNPNFNASLAQKHYSLDDAPPVFTREEEAFLAQAGDLRVAYYDDWSPFVAYDPITDTAKGINVDVLNLITEKTGLRFTYLRSGSQEQAARLLADGQADLLLGFEATPEKQAALGLTASDDFLSVPLCLVGRGMDVGEQASFAVPQSSEEMIRLLKEQFPHSAITILPSAADCYRAVLDGQADFTMDNVYTATHVIGDEKQGLAIAFVFPVKDYYAFGLPASVDPILLRLLNKGIASMSKSELTAIFTRHTANIVSEAPVATLLYTYRTQLAVAAVVLLMLAVGGALLARTCYLRRRKRLWQDTYIDALTGIGNLQLFELELRQRLDENPNTKYVVCQFDIENFKILNEIYGFEAGDRIICQLADELRSMATPELDAYARITSDSFIILKSYTSMEANRKLLRAGENRIRQMGSREFNCLVTLKFGMYYLEDNTETTASILEKANYAHSICKLNPTINRYLYDEADKQSAIEEKMIEARMEEALAQGQFVLYLQPKFRLTDEGLAGAEALVRWRSGENGEMIYPNSFIPLFEKNGFITKLDMYMLELVCKLISGWIAAGEKPTVVSINFSRLHLLNPRFTQQICEIVDGYQVPRKFIEIELTETTMFDNEEAMFTVLQSLHEDGFTLSMDDFGTGYSSLGLLKNLPVDVIKIDRSFFLNSRFKTRARAVIENVLQMARRLDIHTVAEGVETQDDIDMLREMGCEIVQGYYFSRPVPVTDFRLDGVVQPNRLPHVEPKVEATELGNLTLGRAHMGEMTSVLAYRLMQISLRKTLSDMYGDGEMIFALRSTGKVAGGMFARELLDLSLPFDDFLLMLAGKLDELKIGQLSVERLDLGHCGAVITMADDLDCSGIGVCDHTLCQYDEGFLAGIMKEYTQKNYSVTETDCWGTGAHLCRFEIKLT